MALSDLCLVYVWRFALEHAFRFLKQHLGLNANQFTLLHSTELWMWLCALAYWPLLMREVVADYRPAWYRRSSGDAMKPAHAGAGAARRAPISSGVGHSGGNAHLQVKVISPLKLVQEIEP